MTYIEAILMFDDAVRLKMFINNVELKINNNKTMRRYKLIKNYPRSIHLEVGTIVEKTLENCYFPAGGGNGIHPKEVENFPDYWEEILELKEGINQIPTHWKSIEIK